MQSSCSQRSRDVLVSTPLPKALGVLIVSSRPRTKRSLEQKIDCIRRVIINAQDHIRVDDPKRVYSQYVRYALDEIKDMNYYESEAAQGLQRKDVVHEHVVPHSIVMEKLLLLDPVTNERILAFVRKYYVICAITKEEDRRLNRNGLRSKMPEGWDGENDSVFARYDVAKIPRHKVDRARNTPNKPLEPDA